MNIGEASEASAVSRKMIRYYESIGLIQPARRSDAGYRKYGANDVEALRFIKRSRELGFSLDRIRTLIGLWEDTTRQSADVKRLAQQHIDELDRDIAKLQSIRDQLAHLVDCCHGDSRPECPILADLGARSQSVPEQQGG
ncbi:MAG: Cu(I)-responsive transcriptional regulator [Alcaligenaceae bacterium]|nr:Cu(I)-responsive transcriptional regulator [Alcaligenaceae bacterium]